MTKGQAQTLSTAASLLADLRYAIGTDPEDAAVRAQIGRTINTLTDAREPLAAAIASDLLDTSRKLDFGTIHRLQAAHAVDALRERLLNGWTFGMGSWLVVNDDTAPGSTVLPDVLDAARVIGEIDAADFEVDDLVDDNDGICENCEEAVGENYERCPVCKEPMHSDPTAADFTTFVRDSPPWE